MIQDSGERREFESGAVRDIQEGKGRCDLLPLEEVGDILDHDITLRGLERVIQETSLEAQYEQLMMALKVFVLDTLHTDLHTYFLDVSKHYEEGCKKYGERNWEKGIPVHSFIDSAARHYIKWLRGDQDERHDRAFGWNILGAMWTIKHKPELNDLPNVSLTSYV